MRIVRSGIWLCDDCLIYAVNADLTGVDSDVRSQAIADGIARLGPHLVYGAEEGQPEELDLTCRHCDGCGDRLAGRRTAFCILGE